MIPVAMHSARFLGQILGKRLYHALVDDEVPIELVDKPA